LVLANIATSYRECTASQTFDVKDGKIEYKDFDKTFLSVKKITVNGAQSDCSLFIDFLGVPNGRVEVTYLFIPEFGSNPDQEIHLPSISEQTFVYGVMTEYAIISGMFNEAKGWNERFEAGLFGANDKNKTASVKALRW
jgi:hypothetical protein